MTAWKTKTSAAIGFALAVSATAGLALWPCSYKVAEVEAAPPGEPAIGVVENRQTCASLIEVNGLDVLFVLAVPVLLAAIGAVATLVGRRVVLLVSTVALGIFCLLGGFSVGLFYLPAAAAQLLALLSWRQHKDVALKH